MSDVYIPSHKAILWMCKLEAPKRGCNSSNQHRHNQRLKLLQHFKERCAYCTRKLTPETMTVDHIIPLSRGGKNDVLNRVPSCEPCNKHKSNRILTAQFCDNLRHKLLELYST